MGISGSMFTAISSLQAQGQNASVVSNNLANASTSGYKSTSVEFEDVFYSSVRASSSKDQIGNGVRIAAVSTDWTQGTYEDSASVLDMAINGNGFFTMVDPDTDDVYYTRDGNFSLDVEGYLTDAHGNRVQGWVVEDAAVSGSVGDIQIDKSQTKPQPTSLIEMEFNLDAESTNHTTDTVNNIEMQALFQRYNGTLDEPLDDNAYAYQTTISVYDERGTAHDIMLALDPTGVEDGGEVVWEYLVYCNPSEDLRSVGTTPYAETAAAGLLMTGTLTFTSAGSLNNMTAYTPNSTLSAIPAAASDWALADFNEDGNVILKANFTGSDDEQEIGLNFGVLNKDIINTWTDQATTPAAANTSYGAIDANTKASDLAIFADAEFSVNAATSYDQSSAIYRSAQDGYTSGTLQDLELSETGVLTGLYSNGQSIDLYAVALAEFANDDGLRLEGTNIYSATMESGEALLGQAGTSSRGTMVSNALEGSNVDTASEMTDLVILQSVYQASAKVITTADTLLQTAINLKR